MKTNIDYEVLIPVESQDRYVHADDALTDSDRGATVFNGGMK